MSPVGQRIGGGYRFIHALLLDYFTDLWDEQQVQEHASMTEHSRKR